MIDLNSVPYTTRKPRGNEKSGYDYNFMKMKEFEEDVTQGKFICCNEYMGDWYGTEWSGVEAVARQGLACVIQMELESLLSFKQTYFEPRCVLVITLDKERHRERLAQLGCSEKEREMALGRAEWYAEYNREHPGFFDTVIVTDDIEQGYQNLKGLILNYLGVEAAEQQQHEQQLQAQMQKAAAMGGGADMRAAMQQNSSRSSNHNTNKLANESTTSITATGAAQPNKAELNGTNKPKESELPHSGETKSFFFSANEYSTREKHNKTIFEL